MRQTSTETKLASSVASTPTSTDDPIMLLTKNASDRIESGTRRVRRSIRTIATKGSFAGFLLTVAACGVPVDSTEPSASVAASPEESAIATEITTVPSVPLALVDDCVEQTMGRAFSGEEFWKDHWDNLNQDEAELRKWCDQYGIDDPAALAELSRQWQLFVAEVPSSNTDAPLSIVPFADPVVASTVPATTAATAAPPPPAPANVSYANCAAVRAAGAAPIRRGDPGYSSKLDRDGDGIGCE